MALTSRIAAAQDALRTLLDARAALDTVKVDVGEPDTIMAEHIWIAGTINEWRNEQDVSAGTMATAPREETFNLPVVCVVKKHAATYTAVRDRCLVLAGEVEKQLRDSHTINSTVQMAEVFPVSMDEGRDGSERACVIVLDVACRVWLQ